MQSPPAPWAGNLSTEVSTESVNRLVSLTKGILAHTVNTPPWPAGLWWGVAVSMRLRCPASRRRAVAAQLCGPYALWFSSLSSSASRSSATMWKYRQPWRAQSSTVVVMSSPRRGAAAHLQRCPAGFLDLGQQFVQLHLAALTAWPRGLPRARSCSSRHPPGRGW